MLFVPLQALVNANYPRCDINKTAVLLKDVTHHVVVDAHSSDDCWFHLGEIDIVGENEVISTAIVTLLLQILHVIEEVVLV